MIRVAATREGLVGNTTATGHVIQTDDWFCALPSTKALRRIVSIRPEGSVPGTIGFPVLTVPVLDVGPWNEHDDFYVFGTARPQAESGTDTSGRTTNGSGIDLSDLVYRTLGNPSWVLWEML